MNLLSVTCEFIPPYKAAIKYLLFWDIIVADETLKAHRRGTWVVASRSSPRRGKN